MEECFELSPEINQFPENSETTESVVEVKPKLKLRYTKSWIALQCLCAFLMAIILTPMAFYIGTVAKDSNLLPEDCSYSIASSINYCFGVIIITIGAMMLIELAFRKYINMLQYLLVAMALTLFYLLLLSISEYLIFEVSYAIVSVMTISLIVWFVKELTANKKAAKVMASILIAEYALMFVLINLGDTALLVGSLSAFALIAGAMYLTLRLKVENQEVVLKI